MLSLGPRLGRTQESETRHCTRLSKRTDSPPPARSLQKTTRRRRGANRTEQRYLPPLPELESSGRTLRVPADRMLKDNQELLGQDRRLLQLLNRHPRQGRQAQRRHHRLFRSAVLFLVRVRRLEPSSRA